jgi:multidrug efflux pump subunit AcrA (membrane-fusion protein)
MPLAGRVHGILPAASSENLSAPVRIDLASSPGGIGLFGTARIAVGERRDVSAIPEAAVLRDDVYGTARVAFVTADRRTHWVTVTTGTVQDGMVEIVAPPLAPGATVIVAGQVGLPEGTPVRPRS